MEQRAGFEPAVLGICNPLHWAALPPLHVWSGKGDSNSRHSRWQRDALPTELFPHCLAERRGLEPRSRIKRPTD